MRQKKCPYCGNKISSKLESSYPLPIPATTNEEVATLRQPKHSTTFETLVIVPLAQSGIYAILFAIPGGWAYSSIMEINLIGPTFSIGFFTWGCAWVWHSHFFNSLLKPLVTKEEKPEKDNEPPVIIEVMESNSTMTIGEIPSSVATLEEMIEFAKAVKLEISLKRWRLEEVHLTQSEFGGSGKIFSQPNWTKFIRYLEDRKLVEKGKRKNSSYTLTSTGVDFIMKTAKLEL